MKLTKQDLIEIIKEELEPTQDEMEKAVTHVLSQFTSEEQKFFEDDLNSTKPMSQVVSYYLHDYVGRDRMTIEDAMDKLLKLMKSILKHGGVDAHFAAEEKYREEWRRGELERQKELRKQGWGPSAIHRDRKHPPWER